MEYVSWALLVASLVLAAWFASGHGRAVPAHYAVELTSLEVARVAAPSRGRRSSTALISGRTPVN